MNSELVQEIKNMAQAAAQSIHTAVPGTIVSYDPAKGQAVVKPVMKYTTKGGNIIDYPQISGVPRAVPAAHEPAGDRSVPGKAGGRLPAHYF